MQHDSARIENTPLLRFFSNKACTHSIVHSIVCLSGIFLSGVEKLQEFLSWPIQNSPALCTLISSSCTSGNYCMISIPLYWASSLSHTAADPSSLSHTAADPSNIPQADIGPSNFSQVDTGTYSI